MQTRYPRGSLVRTVKASSFYFDLESSFKPSKPDHFLCFPAQICNFSLITKSESADAKKDMCSCTTAQQPWVGWIGCPGPCWSGRHENMQRGLCGSPQGHGPNKRILSRLGPWERNYKVNKIWKLEGYKLKWIWERIM